jgi:hypothetical protein
MLVQNSSVARHPRPPSRSAAVIFYDSRAADAIDGQNRAVRSANCVFCVLNSLFRKIVFPVLRNRIPCSAESYSLFRAKKFPANLTGIWPETPEFRGFPVKTGPMALPKKSINREITPITGNFCGKMRPRAPDQTSAARSIRAFVEEPGACLDRAGYQEAIALPSRGMGQGGLSSMPVRITVPNASTNIDRSPRRDVGPMMRLRSPAEKGDRPYAPLGGDKLATHEAIATCAPPRLVPTAGTL